MQQRCLLATCEWSEEVKDLPNEVWAKGGIGQQRQPLKECVAKRKRCAASELEQTPSSVASAVSRKRRGFTLLHSLVPMRRPGGTAAVLSAKAKDFRGGRNEERGEIASSPSGGRVEDEHSLSRSV